MQEQDLSFRVIARGNLLLGRWAAQRLGLTGAAADTYVGEVVAADFNVPGAEDVIQKVARDLLAKGAIGSDEEVRAQLKRSVEEAQRLIRAEATQRR